MLPADIYNCRMRLRHEFAFDVLARVPVRVIEGHVPFFFLYFFWANRDMLIPGADLWLAPIGCGP